jgi:hypothetical protein
VAGLLVAALGPVSTLVINAVTFAVSAVLVAWLVPRCHADGRGRLAVGGEHVLLA